MEIFVHRKDADQVEEGFTREQLPGLLADENNCIWVDLRGENDEQIEEAREVLKNVFKFHYLTIEDCIETRNQPKIEGFPDYLFFIVHGVKPEETTSTNFVTKELDGYLGKNFVVTFHRERFRSIKQVKQHIRSSTYTTGRGTAYLLHEILDRLIDLYMPLVDDFDASITSLEARVFQMKKTNNSILTEIMHLRRAVARLKRISSRQLEVLYRMSHSEFGQIPEKITPFFRDVHDHLPRRDLPLRRIRPLQNLVQQLKQPSPILVPVIPRCVHDLLQPLQFRHEIRHPAGQRILHPHARPQRNGRQPHLPRAYRPARLRQHNIHPYRPQ